MKTNKKIKEIKVTKPVSKRKFEKLTKAAKRVLIAQDVLNQIEADRFIPEHMAWCKFDHPDMPRKGSRSGDMFDRMDTFLGKHNDSEELQPILNASKCHVCGLGAMFTSAIGMFNNYTVGDLGGGIVESDVDKVLRRYFDKRTLAAVEIAFEDGNGYYKWPNPLAYGDHARYQRENTLSKVSGFSYIDQVNNKVVAELTEYLNKAYTFGSCSYGPVSMMTKIMKNIVDNKGEFKP